MLHPLNYLFLENMKYLFLIIILEVDIGYIQNTYHKIGKYFFLVNVTFYFYISSFLLVSWNMRFSCKPRYELKSKHIEKVINLPCLPNDTKKVPGRKGCYPTKCWVLGRLCQESVTVRSATSVDSWSQMSERAYYEGRFLMKGTREFPE